MAFLIMTTSLSSERMNALGARPESPSAAAETRHPRPAGAGVPVTPASGCHAVGPAAADAQNSQVSALASSRPSLWLAGLRLAVSSESALCVPSLLSPAPRSPVALGPP